MSETIRAFDGESGPPENQKWARIAGVAVVPWMATLQLEPQFAPADEE